MAMCLNLVSLDRVILQMKIKSVSEIFRVIPMSDWFSSEDKPLAGMTFWAFGFTS